VAAFEINDLILLSVVKAVGLLFCNYIKIFLCFVILLDLMRFRHFEQEQTYTNV